jgi:hypothetical protein
VAKRQAKRNNAQARLQYKLFNNSTNWTLQVINNKELTMQNDNYWGVVRALVEVGGYPLEVAQDLAPQYISE